MLGRRRYKVFTRRTYTGRHRFNTKFWMLRPKDPRYAGDDTLGEATSCSPNLQFLIGDAPPANRT